VGISSKSGLRPWTSRSETRKLGWWLLENALILVQLSGRRLRSNPTKGNSCHLFELPGVGESQVVTDLWQLMRRYSSGVVFLSEIKKSKLEMEDVTRRLGQLNGVYADARGRVGGLALLWDKSLDLVVLFFTPY